MQGDAHATAAVRESMRYLGIGVANAVWALDPDVVLVHGAVTEAWPLVMRAIHEQFPTGREIPHFSDLLLRPCTLGQDSGIIGAISLPFISIFATGQVGEPLAAAART
jgi:predicted NBD/HSP70 family sugar kinase